MSLRKAIQNTVELSLKDKLALKDDEIAIATDIMQSRILHALFSGLSRDLVILKGGLAMKALTGSERSTKDIDMAAEPNVNMSTLNKHMHAAINNALRCGLIEETTVREQDLGNGGISPKWHINGKLAGSDTAIHIRIEVSKRDLLPEDAISRFEIAASDRDGVGKYTIRTYSPMAMAASKIAALLDQNRNKPRDLYDLNLLMELDVAPPVAMLAALGKDKLQLMLGNLWHKVASFTYQDFKAEVAPSLPQHIATTISEIGWCEMQLKVAEHIERWLQEAIEVADHPIPRSELRTRFDALVARSAATSDKPKP